MNKRSILYGYQIQNGVLEIVAEEQAVVQQVFERYHAGGSYQSISEELNQEGIPFSLEAPRWNKHKVKRLLEEVRNTRADQKQDGTQSQGQSVTFSTKAKSNRL